MMQSSTIGAPEKSPLNRDEAALEVLRLVNVRTLTDFIREMGARGINVPPYLFNVGANLLKKEPQAIGLLSMTTQRAMPKLRARGCMARINIPGITDTITMPPEIFEQMVRKSHADAIQKIRDSETQDEHVKAWMTIEQALGFPDLSNLPTDDRDRQMYGDIPQTALAAERILRLREAAASVEREIPGSSEFGHIVGNERLMEQIGPSARNGVALMEVLFQLMRKLILEHGFTLNDFV